MADRNTDPNRDTTTRVTTTNVDNTRSGGSNIIWIVLALLVAAALAWWLLGGDGDEAATTDTATNAPDAPAWPRIGGSDWPRATRIAISPSPRMASRALTAMFTRAVSNWLASART